MRIFISHSSHDAETAAGICSILEGEGHSCFIAPRDIRPGKEYAEEIINGISGADTLLLLLSEQSNQSPHVLREVERAGSSRIPITVYKLEEVELTKSLEYFLMTNQWIDGTVDSHYQKVSEAFRSQPDNQTEPDRDQPERSRPERKSPEKAGQKTGKILLPALVLLLAVGGIAFAAGRAGRAGNVMAEGGRQSADNEAKGAGSGSQSADHGAPGAGGGGQSADSGAPYAGSGGQSADSGAPYAGSGGQSADSGAPYAGGGGQGTGSAVLNADNGAQSTDGRTPDVMAAAGGTQSAETVDLRPGASVELGAYEGEPIVWRVLHVSEDEEQLILVSDKILTMKAFDAAESGRYNSDGDKDYWTAEIEDRLLEAQVRGSNLWCDSNIRTWLNSERENVVYEGQAPTASAMSEKKNGYSNEAGFLHGFTEEERAVLREVQIFTIGNCLLDSAGTETDDRVFLLAQEELEWFGEADINIFAAPTENAVEQDQTGWYEGYSLSLGVEEYPWLLRDPAKDSASQCMAVGNGYHTGEISSDMLERIEAGVEGFGIRPAVCVDRQALTELLTPGQTE